MSSSSPAEAPDPSAPSALPTAAAWGRALFVALHLFAVTAMALPSAGSGLTRSAWSSPTVQGEFQSWTDRLNRWGIAITVPELEDRLWAFASGYEDGRQAVLAPFMPYYRYCGTWQSWRMFVAPHRYPGRLEIDIDEGQGWTPLYVARSDAHTWHRAWLDHDRMRAAIFRYSWSHYRTSRKEFTDWVATTVAAERPDARRIRVSWMRYKTPSPDDVLAGKAPVEKRDLTNTRDLRKLR